MSVNVRSTPSIVQISAGRAPEALANTNAEHRYRQVDALGDLLIEVRNDSFTQSMTLAVAVSADNSSFSTQQVRVSGTLANSVTVPPRVSMTVTVDGPNAPTAARAYWRFVVSNQQVAEGVVTIKHDRGELILDKTVYS